MILFAFRDMNNYWFQFLEVADPNDCALYKMEVLRDADLKIRPLFKVTADNGEQVSHVSDDVCAFMT